MKGTVVLIKKNTDIVFLENIDRHTFEEIKQQCGCDHCTCSIHNRIVDLGYVLPVGFKEDDIDWDYGY